MYARLVQFEGVAASRRDDLIALGREQAIPAMKDAEGFGGFISLVDEETGRVRNVVLWETREAAEDWERESASRRDEMVRGVGGTIRSVDLY